MDLPLLRRLAGGEGWGLLQSLPDYDERETLALGERLRRAGFDADLVAAALTQSRLRARGRGKFGAEAARMLFTADGLEQATRPQVADVHAQRFTRAGIGRVLDLGCGIGSDAMAFARAGLQVHAVDADPVTAAIAALNLRPWPHARAACGDATTAPLPAGPGANGTGVWFDPARRTPGVADARGHTRRLFRLEDLTPSWEHVRHVATRVPAVGAKLSPGLSHRRIPPGCEAQWLSLHGEALEASVWWGPLVLDPGRTALVITAHGPYRVTERDAAGADQDTCALGRLPGFVYECDKAVLRAGLAGALVNLTDGRELAPGTGYVASDRRMEVPWARRYAVRDAFPLNVKALRRWTRDHHVGTLTIKKRGVATDPSTLRRQLRLRGDRSATVLLTRVDGSQAALILDTV